MARKTPRAARVERPARAAGRRHYVKVDDAAEYLGVRRETVHKMLADGRLTPYRLGRRVLRIDLNQVDAVMERGGAA